MRLIESVTLFRGFLETWEPFVIRCSSYSAKHLLLLFGTFLSPSSWSDRLSTNKFLHNFCTIVQIVNCQKKITKRWPQFDLYFLSKPEVKVNFFFRCSSYSAKHLLFLFGFFRCSSYSAKHLLLGVRAIARNTYCFCSVFRCSSYSAKHLLFLFGFFFFFFSFFFSG